MTKPKKLIEVALPIREISAESVRDKSIRHGHLSTLHLWWARRPLPVCRAVVFASLVPDPDDPHCPAVFRDAVQTILVGERGEEIHTAYKPYADIPHTAVVDKMEDTLRNRLLMFIGKFSDRYVEEERRGKKTPAKFQLHDASLIKWDNKNNPTIIGRARRLIFVAHNAPKFPDQTAAQLLATHDALDRDLREAEQTLYARPDRHLPDDPETERLTRALDDARAAYLARMPKVFDPFAGGGAIPLEAARLGCNSYGNDINPVAHIIQRGTCEFPQRFGKPITYSKEEFTARYGAEEWQRQRAANNGMFTDETTLTLPNRLSFDVEFYARQILTRVEETIGHLYPKDAAGNRPIAYYWARVGQCANPSCGAEVPLLKQFYLSRKKGKYVHLHPIIEGTDIRFEIREGKTKLEGWVRHRKNLYCPCCKNLTPNKILKSNYLSNPLPPRLLAVIADSPNGKVYRKPSYTETTVVQNLETPSLRTEERMSVKNTKQFDICGWGYERFDQLFSQRQLLLIESILKEFSNLKDEVTFDRKNYGTAVWSYLAIWFDRIAIANTSFGIWHNKGEKLERIMGRQAILMVFDYPESNPFSGKTGSAKNQLNWIIRYINDESSTFSSSFLNASSGEKNQFESNEIDAVVTDPPYYDAIPYADLSDFFYVWLKRTLGNIYELNFATPQTPKTEECTAIKYHHDNSDKLARQHFDNKLLQIFDAIEYQTNGLVSIMFAHQSTEAWETLCNSVLNARMNLVASWANDTEMMGALKKGKDFLASSITVVAKPSEKRGFGDYIEVRTKILATISKEVGQLYKLGFRGADLLTACFGKAVSVFGNYRLVEKADGTEVSVQELLEMARDAAFNAIVSDIDTDDETRFYLGWLNLFGFSAAAHDDVRRIVQVGLDLDVDTVYRKHLLLKEKDEGRLGKMSERIEADPKIGLRNAGDSDLDRAHRMMYLYDDRTGNRDHLLVYLRDRTPTAEHPTWRVLNSLVELLPKTTERDLAAGLLSNQDNLLRAARQYTEQSKPDAQLKMDLSETN